MQLQMMHVPLNFLRNAALEEVGRDSLAMTDWLWHASLLFKRTHANMHKEDQRRVWCTTGPWAP